MIKPFSGYDEAQAYSGNGGDFQKLPAGGYEAVVMGVQLAQNNNGTGRLEIMVDITTGEFKNYFKKQYDGSQFADKKYKGIVKYNIPTDDGSPGDETKKNFFRGMTKAFEESNPNYKWDWDETKLKGLRVGIFVRDKEYDWNGKHGFSPEIFAVTSLKTIQEGNFEIPKPHYLQGNSGSGNVGGYFAPVGNPAPPPLPSSDDYPF